MDEYTVCLASAFARSIACMWQRQLSFYAAPSLHAHTKNLQSLVRTSQGMAPAARQTLVACALLLTPAVFQVCAALKVPSQVAALGVLFAIPELAMHRIL
eukprot:34434-Amphidinium_carterae.1